MMPMMTVTMPMMTVKIPGIPVMIAAAVIAATAAGLPGIRAGAALMPTVQTTTRAGWSVSGGYRDFQLYPQPMKKAWSATGVGRTDTAPG